MASTAGGGVLAVTRTGEPLGASVSPVWVLASLATAPRSPAGSEAAGVCSLPRRWNRPCRRSSPPLETLTRWSSVLMVPESTLNSESCPTKGSAMVLNTYASGCPAASAVTSTCWSPAMHGDGPVGRRRADLADEVGQPVDPDAGHGRAEHDGELRAVQHLVGQGALELVDRRHLAGEVALQLLVVAGDDLLDELVVHAVLLVGDVGRQGLAAVLPVGLVLEGLVGEDVGHAVERGLLAEG